MYNVRQSASAARPPILPHSPFACCPLEISLLFPPSVLVLPFVLQQTSYLAMDTTLTIRLPAAQRKALRRRAAAEKTSESAIVREMIEREMKRGFDYEAVRHLIGSVSSEPQHWNQNAWRRHIRKRNWRS